MADEDSALTMGDVREEAGKLLSAIHAHRSDATRFQENWLQLWQLAREATAARLVPNEEPDGPWSIDGKAYPFASTLTGGGFAVPVWPADAARAGIHLSRLLNWARVPVPDPC